MAIDNDAYAKPRGLGSITRAWVLAGLALITPCIVVGQVQGQGQEKEQGQGQGQGQTSDAERSWFADAFLNSNNYAYSAQGGVDAWNLKPSVAEDASDNQQANTRLFLANSTTYGSYQNPAPWVKFEGSLRPFAGTLVTLKYRYEQSSGSRIDELSVDQAYHALGARLGVLDYKTSWCRTYDLASPWIRENDPFCVVRSSSAPTRGAPGAQAYLNLVASDFKIQAIAGVYSPLWFNYEDTEFTNVAIRGADKVFKNDKYGVSLNATQLESGLELRLSYLHSDQSANVSTSPLYPQNRLDQVVDVLYAGASINLTPNLNLRFTQLNSDLSSKSHFPSGYFIPDDTTPAVFNEIVSPKVSRVLELNYQANAKNTLAFAYSVYDLSTDNTNYKYASPRVPPFQLVTDYVPNAFAFRNTSASLGWRRDWARGLYTVVQFTHAEQHSSNVASVPVYFSSMGNALGLRLGYRL